MAAPVGALVFERKRLVEKFFVGNPEDDEVAGYGATEAEALASAAEYVDAESLDEDARFGLYQLICEVRPEFGKVKMVRVKK
jgi:hypothetical protein